jgi:formylglycine-generating enzyme required for sulfatase activity
MPRAPILLALASVCLLLAVPAHAQVDPNSGIDFVRIGSAGNAAYPGGFVHDPATNRGGVNHDFSIGKYEVTSGQWSEFFTAARNCPDGSVPYVPLRTINGNPMLPVGGISWRTAAVYCNWLCNYKGTNLASFTSGAYDVSTFAYTAGGRFTDQLTHTPGAQYWIPTWDEWLKAAHYDPAKVNSDGTTGGWWEYSNGSDSQWIPGPPGALVNGRPTTANVGWTSNDFPGYDPSTVLLGAYAATSPFDLYDVAGGSSEWTEEPAYFVPGDVYPTERYTDGTSRGGGLANGDRISYFTDSGSPSAAFPDMGLRLASSVPSPGSCSLWFGAILVGTLRRRRTHEGGWRGSLPITVTGGLGSFALGAVGRALRPPHDRAHGPR